MDNFSGGAGDGGFPSRNSRSSFNDPVAPPPSFSNVNGMLSRPSGSVAPPTSQRDELSNNRGRQQPSHEVFMVREASRSNLNPPSVGSEQRLPFAGASADPLNLAEQRERELTNPNPSKSSTRHSRSEREKESSKLILPRMLKIAVVGDSTSGKTGICNAFTSEGYSFSRNYHMTTGVSIYAKSIKLPGSGRGGGGEGSSTEDPLVLESRINLVLVDSAGKPLYRELLPQYWDQLDGFALVIDLTSTTALETGSAWINLAKECMKAAAKSRQPDESEDQSGKRGADHPTTLGVLIGSKSDLKEQRVISPKAAQDFASQHELQYFECSAKANTGMEEPFFYLAHQWATTHSAANSIDKENAEGASAGGIYPKNANATGSSSRRSVFASRQSSSENF